MAVGDRGGIVRSRHLSLTDLYPTLSEIVGDDPAPGVALDGVSLMPLLRGEAATRGKAEVHYSSNGTFALRDGPWKLVFGSGDGGLPGRSPEPFSHPWQLYNLENDQGEREDRYDIVHGHLELTGRMKTGLNNIRAEEDESLSSDASLRFLALAGVDLGTFDPGVLAYRGFVGRDFESVFVYSIPAAIDAEVRIPGAETRTETSGRGLVSLSGPGAKTTVSVAVTAPDGNAASTYTVEVIRVGQPAISGRAQVGETLTANTSGVVGADTRRDLNFTCQWTANDGTTGHDIAGATGANYILTEEEEGKTIRVRVSFSDAGGNQVAATSSPTAAVAAAFRAPGVPGDLRLATRNSGELSVAWQAPESNGSRKVSGYLVQWKESSGSWETASDVSESTVTGTSHIIRGLTDGKEYAVRVRAVNAAGAGAAAEASAIPVDPPLTARFIWMPASHNGIDEFWIFIEFSEEIASEVEAIRNHSLTIAGGEVTSVREFGSSDLWMMSVTPDGAHDVTLVLPATSNCSDQGAICTGGGKMLSNRISATIHGP